MGRLEDLERRVRPRRVLARALEEAREISLGCLSLRVVLHVPLMEDPYVLDTTTQQLDAENPIALSSMYAGGAFKSIPFTPVQAIRELQRPSPQRLVGQGEND